MSTVYDTTTDPHQLSSLFVKYFNAGDVDGLLSLYEEGATLYLPGDDALTPVPLRAAFEKFSSGGISIEPLKAYVCVKDDLALSLGHIELISATEQIVLRTTEILRRQGDGTWRYVIDNAIGSALLEHVA